jgi:hypothetical protein
MKQLLMLLIITTVLLPGFGQDNWRELPPDTNASSFSNASSYDIAAGQSGTYYLIYTDRKAVPDADYMIYVDGYTVAGGWSRLAALPTFNQSDVSVRTLQIGSGIYLMANTGPGNRLTLFEISGADVFELDTEDFPERKSDWKIYPGTGNGEIWFTYGDRLYQYDYVAASWSRLEKPSGQETRFSPEPWPSSGVSGADLIASSLNRRLQVNTKTNRSMIAYVMADSSQVTLKITNNPPEFASAGIVPAQVFGRSFTNLLSAVQMKDADDDDIRLESVVSSNNSVIDPELVQVSLYNSMHGLTMVSVDAVIGNVVAAETVVLTFSFTDGFDVLQRVITYTVQPNPQK